MRVQRTPSGYRAVKQNSPAKPSTPKNTVKVAIKHKIKIQGPPNAVKQVVGKAALKNAR
jgi:hypothetical protein